MATRKRSAAATTPVVAAQDELSFLPDSTRLELYEQLIQGCTHVWSKNKLQETVLDQMLKVFMRLAEEDPMFLAHFTSYAMTKLDSKDLKVLSVFANFLSDADGSQFSPNSKYRKPNWRVVSQAALQMRDFDAKMVNRIFTLANRKKVLGSGIRFKEGTHVPKVLKTAIRKYLRFREQHPSILKGVRKVGLGNVYKQLYRNARIAPSIDAASLLGWKQKDGRTIAKTSVFDFKNLSDLEIAEKIRRDKLSPTGVLGALPRKLTPVVAAAILEQSTGDQAVILRSSFDEQGLLKNAEVMKVFKEKISTAKTALDRVTRINTDVDASVTDALKHARSDKRKQDVGDLGKIFVHVDKSSSLTAAIATVIDMGAIFAEAVTNPRENFGWGLYHNYGKRMELPETFEADAFRALLYNVRPEGCTNAMALYPQALSEGFKTHVFITDGEHNQGDIDIMMAQAHAQHGKPSSVIIVRVGNSWHRDLENAFKHAGVPCVVVTPNALTQSALVSQTIKTAIKGQSAVIDEIMATPLLKLPDWWESVKVNVAVG